MIVPGVPLNRTCVAPSKVLYWPFTGAFTTPGKGPMMEPKTATISPGASAPESRLPAFATEDMRGLPDPVICIVRLAPGWLANSTTN